MPKKVTAKNHKNPYILKSKTNQCPRVASQQSLHTKSTDKLNHFNIIQGQTPLKIKKSLHDLPRNNSKHSPLNTHKSKRLTSKRLQKSPPISKLQFGIKIKNKPNLKTKDTQFMEVHLQNNHHYNLPSFRQYCIVDSDFVPLATSDQKRFFTGLMANTVSTCDPQNWASRIIKPCSKGLDSDQQIDIFVPKKLKNSKQNQNKNQRSQQQSDFIHQNENIFHQRNEFQKSFNYVDGINNKSKINGFCQTDQKSTRNQQIQIQLNLKQYEEMGTQYSNRQNLNNINGKQIKNFTRKEQQLQTIKNMDFLQVLPRGQRQKKHENNRYCENQRRQESVQQILLKLQFLHLPDKSSFSHLTAIQRQHYSQLLQSLLGKMMVSPRTPRYDNEVIPNQRKVNIRSTSLDEERSNSPMSSQNESQKSPSKRLQGYMEDFQVGQSQQNQKLRALQMMNYQIEIRQLKQLGMIQTSSNPTYTLIGIANLLTNLMTFLELNYGNQMVQILNRVYGYSYKDRFLKITNNIHNSFNYKKLLPDSMYNDFLQQVVSQSQLQSNDLQQSILQQSKWVYLKAIFDCLNQQIDSYRAFYSSDGQPYPWSLKIIKSITYFTIDEESIQIVFSQIKQKIIGYSSNLCGLLIQSNTCPKQNPLIRKRNQVELKMVQNEIIKLDQTPQIQNQSTRIMLELSSLVINQLIDDTILDLINIDDERYSNQI